MAVEQLPADQYVVGGQLTVAGWVLPENSYGIEEDGETKQDAAGVFKSELTYSRRQTLSVTLECTAAGTQADYSKGGTILSGVFVNSQGGPTAWKIRNVTDTRTRGPRVVTLDLIALTEGISAPA